MKRGLSIGRRRLLRDGVSLGVGLAFLPALAPAQTDPAALRPQKGDLLVRSGDASATPLRPDDIKRGESQTLAWAMDPLSGTVRSGSRLNLVLLLRFDPEGLGPATRSRSADGIVGYTAICTHTGCEVEEWKAEAQLLYCGCHASMFDPKDGARVVDGPAPRMLPALPLTVVDGRLVVAGAFTSRVGFEVVWRRLGGICGAWEAPTCARPQPRAELLGSRRWLHSPWPQARDWRNSRPPRRRPFHAFSSVIRR